MIWGSWKRLDWVPEPATLAVARHRTWLGFNEPDRPDQANLSVEEALELWEDLQVEGVRLGSPAPANRDWLEAFMRGIESRGLRVDFITFHWYGWESGHCNDTSRLESKIEWAEQWRRPIWITEWSCRNHSPEVTRRHFREAQAVFARHPLVERYAWYLSRSDGSFEDARLVTSGGALTPLGVDYAASPTP